MSPPDPALLPSVEPTLLPEAGNLTAPETLEERLAAHPEDARAWFELGCSLNRRGRPGDALRALDACLTLSPEQPAARCERGLALLSLRRLDDAAEAFEELLAEHPLDGTALFALGSVRYRQHRFTDATALWRHAAAFVEDPVEALENLAAGLQHLERPDEERSVWQQILACEPGHPAAIHKLASLGVGPVPERASDAYLCRLFDAFADEFEDVLDALHYAGPELLSTMAGRIVGPPAGLLRVLDAGCGTGLCGERFRPWARLLVGIDLSGNMLKRAESRGIYDRLHRAELTRCADVESEHFELVVAADVFNYFGALESVLHALVGRLANGGHLLFTLEHAESRSAARGFNLGAHGRYAHQPEYVRQCLEQAGARLIELGEATLRYELRQPVRSLVVAARKLT